MAKSSLPQLARCPPINLGFESGKSKPRPAAGRSCVLLEPSLEEWKRDGGAGAGGQVEEQVELEEEGEGGELHQQWDRHQDAAEALRR